MEMEPAMSSQRGTKRQAIEIEENDGKEKVYRFKILLPSGVSIGLNVRDPPPKMPVDEFVSMVKREYVRLQRHSGFLKQKRPINWKGERIFLEDANDMKLTTVVNFGNFKPHKCHILRLYVSISCRCARKGKCKIGTFLGRART